MWILSSHIQTSIGVVGEALDKKGIRWTSQGYCIAGFPELPGHNHLKDARVDQNDHDHAEGDFLGFSEP